MQNKIDKYVVRKFFLMLSRRSAARQKHGTKFWTFAY
jgi:hypothetical protein